MLTGTKPSEQTSAGQTGISRRSFVKGAGTVGIVAAVGGSALLEFFTRDAGTKSSELVSRWVASTCQGCTSWCPVVVRVVDGRAGHVGGNAGLGEHDYHE